MSWGPWDPVSEAGQLAQRHCLRSVVEHCVVGAGVPYTASYDGPPRVCILGGGFGGLYTAIKLELLMWPKGKKPKASAAAAEKLSN